MLNQAINQQIPGGSTPLVAGQRPGSIYIEALDQWVDAKTWMDGVIYDTEQIVTPYAAGTRLDFFRNLNFAAGPRKDERYTNMVTPNQLPSGWYAKVYAMSFRVLQNETAAGSGLFTTAEDVQRIMNEGVALLRTANEKTERELPLLMWPSPYGLTGSIARTGAAWTTWSFINNGIPSVGAMTELRYPVELTNELTFQGTFYAPGGLVLDNNCLVMMELHCIQSRPLR